MTFEELRRVIDEQLAAIPDGMVQMHEAEVLAPKFQSLRAVMAQVQLTLEMERNKYTAVRKTLYKNAVLTVVGKTVLDREAQSKADPDLLNAEEYEDNLNSRIQYLRTMSDVFNNFHIYYRMLAKGA